MRKARGTREKKGETMDEQTKGREGVKGLTFVIVYEKKPSPSQKPFSDRVCQGTRTELKKQRRAQ